MKNPRVFHLLRIRYLGPTNTMGSRVKITSDRFKESRTIPYDYAITGIEDMAIAYLQPLGFHIVGTAEGYVIADTFQGLK